MGITDGPAESRRPRGRLPRRLGWFGLIYLASLAAFAGLVYALKALIPHGGG